MSYTRYDRQAWGALPPRQAPYASASLDYFIGHYVGTVGSLAGASPMALCRSIQRAHMDGNGWNDIGYNDLVDLAGNVYTGRGIWVHNAANGTNVNARSYAVCALIGTDDMPSPAMIRTLRELYGEYLTVGGYPSAPIGHRDVEGTPPLTPLSAPPWATICPGPLEPFLTDLTTDNGQPPPPPEGEMAQYQFTFTGYFPINGIDWKAYDCMGVPAGATVYVLPRRGVAPANAVGFGAVFLSGTGQDNGDGTCTILADGISTMRAVGGRVSVCVPPGDLSPVITAVS